jgi:hypothetical protein
MANLDKTSVRTEVSRLKADFEKLCADGKIAGESQAVMNSLFMVVELILAIFLERTTKKDATNSSKPSSQTGKDESALGHSGSHGKGKLENKRASQNRRTVETVALSQVETCDGCGEDLTGVPNGSLESGAKTPDIDDGCGDRRSHLAEIRTAPASGFRSLGSASHRSNPANARYPCG